MLTALLVVLLAGALLAWWGERLGSGVPRAIALATLAIGLVLALTLLPGASPADSQWLRREAADWIPRFGVRYQLALDGLSLTLVLLTLALGLVALASAWREITTHVGFFYFNLLAGIAGAVGVFVALDLLLFFFFWEVMLVPMYFLIALWGHGNRHAAAIKFFIFTQGASLLMLAAMLALVLLHQRATGVWTFDYFTLLETPLSGPAAFWPMLGFFVAFAVKLPVVPLHPWLPDAHTDAPTAGSVILAGVLLKTGAYGIARFVLPLFPEASVAFAPVAIWLGAIGVVYGAILAFAQDDFKRLVAYSSISHLGFALIGLYAFNTQALQGAVMQLVAHGISTGALFMLAGALQQRMHTRDLREMGGLAAALPRLAAFVLFFAVASLGLPGLGNFVGEFLVLLGAFRVERWAAVVATLGLIAAAAYALILVQRALHGPLRRTEPMRDLLPRESCAALVLAVGALALGVHPQPLFDLSAPAVRSLVTATASFTHTAGLR
jgi:NADH-quinone oxidoreductase subunit M